LTDNAGAVETKYSYDSYGSTTTSGEPSDNPFQYTGRENDGMGLYYYRARYFSPELQRFISEDPIGIGGGINFFAYVGNNPINYRDSLGLMLWNPVGPEGCKYYKDRCNECGGGTTGDAYSCAVYQCCKDFGYDPTVNCIRGCLIKWDKEKCSKLPEPGRSKCRREAHIYCYDRCLGHYIYFFIPLSCNRARHIIGY